MIVVAEMFSLKDLIIVKDELLYEKGAQSGSDALQNKG